MLQRLPDDGEATTGIRASREARERGRRLRLLPGEGGRGGWRRARVGELRVRDAVLDWLQIGAQEVDQEMCQVKVNRIEKKGRTRAHRCWRNWPDELAEAAVSDEQ
jgi:hypothetical protein